MCKHRLVFANCERCFKTRKEEAGQEKYKGVVKIYNEKRKRMTG